MVDLLPQYRSPWWASDIDRHQDEPEAAADYHSHATRVPSPGLLQPRTDCWRSPVALHVPDGERMVVPHKRGGVGGGGGDLCTGGKSREK